MVIFTPEQWLKAGKPGEVSEEHLICIFRMKLIKAEQTRTHVCFISFGLPGVEHWWWHITIKMLCHIISCHVTSFRTTEGSQPVTLAQMALRTDTVNTYATSWNVTLIYIVTHCLVLRAEYFCERGSLSWPFQQKSIGTSLSNAQGFPKGHCWLRGPKLILMVIAMCKWSLLWLNDTGSGKLK